MSNWWDAEGVAARFDSKVDRTGRCHLWTGARMPAGYGVFRLKNPRRQEYAHRLALARKLGRALSPGVRALHVCDNPPCVNPDHLREGTQTDNMRDAVSRGRIAHGESFVSAHLTESQVREILALTTVVGLTDKEIGSRYGVSGSSVGNIRKGRTWRRVTGL